MEGEPDSLVQQAVCATLVYAATAGRQVHVLELHNSSLMQRIWTLESTERSVRAHLAAAAGLGVEDANGLTALDLACKAEGRARELSSQLVAAHKRPVVNNVDPEPWAYTPEGKPFQVALKLSGHGTVSMKVLAQPEGSRGVGRLADALNSVELGSLDHGPALYPDLVELRGKEKARDHATAVIRFEHLESAAAYLVSAVHLIARANERWESKHRDASPAPSAKAGAAPKPRNLVEVIDQLVAEDPELKDALGAIRESALYAAPETMPTHWGDVANLLEVCRPTGHPKCEALKAIFNGPAADRSGGGGSA